MGRSVYIYIHMLDDKDMMTFVFVLVFATETIGEAVLF
jgi:hypothetical protein